MANPDLIPSAGEVLADKYRVERVLGRGGMGIVLSAMHLKLDESVAIKFLLPELSHDPALVARFLREARAAIKIRSEHVVRVLDVATLPGGTPYMVMEHLQGKNLDELLEQQGRLPSEVVVDHLLQATEALAEAHALGMVHRDLKPANLFLAHRADGSPCVKVLDFGITKVSQTMDANAFEVTNTSVVMGSPRYMSPEQMRSSRALDPRADIWAIGVILHELIAGVAPFDGATMPELLAAVLQDPPPPLRQLRPDAPEGLERIVAKCLAKDPADRYADVAALTQALAPFGTASARLSADRVSRVMRPRSIDTSTSAPIVRDAFASILENPTSSEFRPEPPTLETVTVNADRGVSASDWIPTRPPPPSTARRASLAVAAVFFAATMIVALAGGARPTARPASQARAAAVGPPAGLPREPLLPSVDLVPAPSTVDAIDTAPSASAKVTTAAEPAKRRARPLVPPAATAVQNEADLFDGRK